MTLYKKCGWRIEYIIYYLGNSYKFSYWKSWYKTCYWGSYDSLIFISPLVNESNLFIIKQRFDKDIILTCSDWLVLNIF